MKIEFNEIERLEAMALIDSGDIDDLYYVYTYHHSKYGYGDIGEGTMRFIVPSDWECTDPIKYHGLSKDNRLFRRKTYLNEPTKQENTFNRRYIGHTWLKRTVTKSESARMPTHPIKLSGKEEK